MGLGCPALLFSDTQGDGAVEADLITPWGGQTLPRRVRGHPVEKTLSLPKYQQYSLVYLGAQVQMDLFLDDSQEGKTVRLPPGSMQVWTMDSAPEASSTHPPGFPGCGRQQSQGVTVQGHKILHKKLPPSPPEPTSPPGKEVITFMVRSGQLGSRECRAEEGFPLAVASFAMAGEHLNIFPVRSRAPPSIRAEGKMMLQHSAQLLHF